MEMVTRVGADYDWLRNVVKDACRLGELPFALKESIRSAGVSKDLHQVRRVADRVEAWSASRPRR